MYDIQTYLNYCRVIQILQEKGKRAEDDEEAKSLIESLPLSPIKMQSSLDNNWRYILKKMDPGIREELSMQIPPDEHEQFLLRFCAEYKKRYGLDFRLPEKGSEQQTEVLPHVQERRKRSKQNYGTVDTDRESPNPFDDRNCLRETDKQPKKKRVIVVSNKPNVNTDACILYYARRRLVSQREVSGLREWIGALVVYDDKVYEVVDVGKDKTLYIDRETKWSETTAVKPNEVRRI